MGRFGNKHRCSSQTYLLNNTYYNSSKGNTSEVKILDRETLYHYRKKERLERRALGRKHYSDNSKLHDWDYSTYFESLERQLRSLCNGSQIKVCKANL